MSKVVKIYDGTQDAATYARKMGALVEQVNLFAQVFNKKMDDAKITLNLERLQDASNGFRRLQLEVNQFIEDAPSAFQKHYKEYFEIALFELGTEWGKVKTSLIAHPYERIPQELRYMIEQVSFDGKEFVVRDYDKTLFDRYMDKDIYDEWETFIKANNKLNERYGDTVFIRYRDALYTKLGDTRLDINKLGIIAL